jgi:hypothetical protein
VSDISDHAVTAIEHLGGHAPAWKIAEHVAANVSEDDYHDATRSGFIAIVRNALRVADGGGLPSAVSVNGEYVQTSMLDVDQYRIVIGGYLNRSSANRIVAEKFNARCVAVHGVSVLDDDVADTGT